MIDEKLGRSYAKKQHCNYIGSFGVLLAKELDLIDEVKPLLTVPYFFLQGMIG